jgi:hypothetical protein
MGMVFVGAGRIERPAEIGLVTLVKSEVSRYFITALNYTGNGRRLFV